MNSEPAQAREETENGKEDRYDHKRNMAGPRESTGTGTDRDDDLAAMCDGPLSVPLPFSPVPISLTNLAVYFALYVLGRKRACVSYLLYLLIGFAGIPVFSGFTAGPGKLLGPTGGYLVGFMLMALIGGYVTDRWPFRPAWCFAGLAGGTAVCYLFGTLWLAGLAHMSLAGALAAGVLPFIPGDICKIIIALVTGPVIRKRLDHAGGN